MLAQFGKRKKLSRKPKFLQSTANSTMICVKLRLPLQMNYSLQLHQDAIKEKFQKISEAYSVLSDESLRAKYDASLLASKGSDFTMDEDFMEKVRTKTRTTYTCYW